MNKKTNLLWIYMLILSITVFSLSGCGEVPAQTESFIESSSEPQTPAITEAATEPATEVSGAPVTEAPKGFFCVNRACRFAVWKDNRFFTDKGQKVTAKIIAHLLKEGSVRLTNLKSAKNGKSYDANVFMDASGEGVPRFRLEFDRKEAK